MALSLAGIPSLLPLKSSFSVRCHHQQAAFSANPPRKDTALPCIYCRAQQASEEGPTASQSETWAQQPDGARKDSYAGWSFLDNNNKRNKFSGFLQVGAGIALAVGFAFAAHAGSKRVFGPVVVPAPSIAIFEEKILPSLTESFKAQENEAIKESGVAVDEEEMQADKLAEEQHAHEPSTTLQQQDAATNHTGQVSLPSDEIEEVSDGVSSPASAGAASTFGDESAGEGNADRSAVESGEEASSPAASTSESVSDETTSEIVSQSPEIDADAVKSDTPASGTDSESGSPVPETLLTEDATEAPAEFPIPSKEPLVVVISELPVDAGGQALLVSTVGGEAEVSEVLVPAKSDGEVEVVLSVTSSPSITDLRNDDVSSPPAKVEAASPGENAAELTTAPDADDIGRVTSAVDSVSPSLESEFWHFTSVVIPAPSAPSALASGRVLIPAVVDHAQEQAVAVLQSIKVVEPGVGAADLCTRREYARWLVAANRALAKSTAAKVLPAMYIEKSTEVAFDDVSPNDPDFPFIQGLAEAGLISSKLSADTAEGGSVDFLPDRPLSRQDLISWKLALDHHSLPVVDRNILQEKTGFIDIDQIHKDAWPSVAADVCAGNRSIIASAFGYTRRFQPHKPVTTGQAAVALVSGDASEQISEELERLEAEKLAEKAVAAEIALEARAQKEANAAFQEELELQKQMTIAAEALVESLREELEQLRSERETEKFDVLKERASLEAAKDTLSQARIEVDGLLQELSSEKVKVVFERNRLEKLLVEIEEERDSLENIKSETEVEKKALGLARSWAEDEAKKARAHAKILEEARKRWEAQGIEVHVDKDLSDYNIPVPSWQFNGDKFELESPQQQQQQQQQPKAPMHEILVKADEYKGKSLQFLREALDISNQKLSIVQQKILVSVGEIAKKAQEIQRSTFFVVKSKAGDFQGAAASMASGFSTVVAENTQKLADGCKGSAEKLAQIFKS